RGGPTPAEGTPSPKANEGPSQEARRPGGRGRRPAPRPRAKARGARQAVKAPAPLAALGLLLASAACDNRLDHPFGGYAYNQGQGCLFTSGAVDVIARGDPGMCPVLPRWQAPGRAV